VTTAPARRWRSGRGRRLATLVAAASAAVVPLAGVHPAAADPTPSPTPTSTLPLVISLTSMRPFAPQPGDTLALTGRITNVSVGPVTSLSLQLLESPTQIATRGEFDTYAATPDGAPPTDAVAAASADVRVAETTLAAGASEPFSIGVPVDDLSHPVAWQVYELALVATGSSQLTAVTGSSAVAGQLRTFLPWAPVPAGGGTSGFPMRVALVWPLVDRPHRGAADGWVDDTLAGSFAAGGRLHDLVAAGLAAEEQHRRPPKPVRHTKTGRHQPKPKPPPPPQAPLRRVPLTWAIDPMLVEDATRMAAGYDVGPAGDQHPGAGQDAAKAWLADLRSAVSEGSVLALPYADPDVTAEVHGNLEQEAQVATTEGETLLASALGRTPLAYSWPPDGFTDQRTVDALFAAGVTTFVLDSASLAPVVPPNFTPTAHTTHPSRDGDVDVLLTDNTLDGAVDAAAANHSLGAAAVQRVLSELLMIQAERPYEPPQRTVVIAPSRRWAPSASMARTLAAGAGRVPWIQPIPLTEVAAAQPDPMQRGDLALTPDERARLLSPTYLEGVSAITSRIDDLAAVLPPGDPIARHLDDAKLRLLSSAWRDVPLLADEARSRLLTVVNDTIGQVAIASKSKSTVTLTSNSGTVPITVSNNLDSPVKVTVQVDSVNQLVRTSEPVTETIPPHRSVPVDIHATVNGSGVFPMNVQLYTPSTGPTPHHQPLLSHPVLIYLKSTAYGVTALIITGGASAVLFVTVVFRLVRRAASGRRRRAGA
jgi:hypothetical protein